MDAELMGAGRSHGAPVGLPWESHGIGRDSAIRKSLYV